MEIKKTLLMPKTAFEMRGNLNRKEPKILNSWFEMDVYSKMNQNREGLESYVIHDGPPYANGNIHCGHMLNRIIKDFVLRYKNMCGYYTPFIFGWDTHGLPIENNVTKSGVNRKTTPINEFRKKCEEYALKQVSNQKEQIKRLGVLGDFNNPYLTLTKEYEASQLEVFKEMCLKGLIYKGLKPVYWSYSSESALAEAEIEYKDVESYAIYVNFKVVDGLNIIPNDTACLVWTTTPWTLPANLAVCANDRFTYGLYESKGKKYLFLKQLEETIKNELELSDLTLIKDIQGKDLEGIVLKHPYIDRNPKIILGDFVTEDAGTGLVHIAPGHGEDDYKVGLKYKLEPFCPVDYKGFMLESAGEEVASMFYLDANDKIVEILKENGNLLKLNKLTHAYPHDWRTSKPVIFRATPQWFCSIEPIRNKVLDLIKDTKWNPKWGETRIYNMIKDRNDWCISRQRIWGVPIPIIYNEDGSPIMEKEVFDRIIKLVKEKGSNVWYELDVKELLPEGYSNKLSPNNGFYKEKDIMDVWFDSGSSFNGVLKERGLKYPCDLYLEGSDQYRGWFNSSLIISAACNDVAPYKEVVSHGFIMDEKWEKMSKSKGNGIDPIKIANVYGSDILRFWAANVDYQSDVRISESIIVQCTEGYRKIRNTFKFLLGNLTLGEDEKFKKEMIPDSFERVDLYILASLEELKNKVIKHFDNFNFQQAVNDILTFMSTDLSSFYLDITKDILYCCAKDSLRRRQVQGVIYEVIDTLMRLLNPIIPFTMDEVNANFTLDVKNVQFLSFPKKSSKYDVSILSEYKEVLKIRNDVLKAIELKRREEVVGSSQEANVSILLKDNKNILSSFDEVELNRLFIVSKATLVDEFDDKDFFEGLVSLVKVERVKNIKCERCWNYSDDVIEVDGVKLCKRCYGVINEK